MKSREEIQADFDAKLETLSTKLEEYSGKAKDASNSINKEFNDNIAELESKLQAGKEKSKEMASASDEKFEELRSQAAENWDALSSKLEDNWSALSDKIKNLLNR